MILSSGRTGRTVGVENGAALKTCLLVFASLVLYFGCAVPAAAREKRIVFGPATPKAKSVLELRVEQIDLEGYTMEAALRAIEDAVDISTDDRFSFGVRTSQKISGRPGRQVNIKKVLRNPEVRVHATRTTLCAVINDLCRQSGWSYAWFGDGLGFIDDRSYFGEKPFDCYNDRGDFFKRRKKRNAKERG